MASFKEKKEMYGQTRLAVGGTAEGEAQPSRETPFTFHGSKPEVFEEFYIIFGAAGVEGLV